MGMGMGMGMDETQMILALQALRALLDKGDRGDCDELVVLYRALGKAIVKNKPMKRKDRDRVAEYLREAGWRERAIGAATAHAATEAEGVIPSRAEPSTVS
jgi:hypothetical protein